jgi:hypothetical protein
MKFITPAACTALLIGCAVAIAQTSNAPPDQSNMAPMASQADTTKGNNLVGTTPTDQTAVPATAGQDKVSGNDLADPKANKTHNPMRQASATHPEFDTLDTKTLIDR